jgi:hypothetical protein
LCQIISILDGNYEESNEIAENILNDDYDDDDDDDEETQTNSNLNKVS